MGRPTKYNDEILAKAQDYVENYQNYGDILPTVEGLSLVLDITRDTIWRWAKDDERPEFSDTLAKLAARQKQELFFKGLTGEYNSTIAKLGLSCNHGMIEKSAQELSGPDGGPVPIQEVVRTIVDPQHPDS